MENKKHTPKNKTIDWLGGRYAGELKGGIPHGRGRIILKNETRYKGQWAEGMPHGRGTIIYPDGSFYSGEIVRGKRHGAGKMQRAKGALQEGQWENNRFAGPLAQKPPPEAVISLEALTFFYKNGQGIEEITFTVHRGECFGFLGPNGAGKTTTIRNLLGFTRPQAGTCHVLGLDCWHQAHLIQKQLGYLPGEMSFFDELSGKKFLDLVQGLRGGAKDARRQMLLERLELNENAVIGKMSKGMKQKLGLVTAFMHDPAVYILDEPTSGLDPLMQNRFTEMILEEKKRGKTILMSSHNFEEVFRSCERAGIIRQGRLVAVENVAGLKSSQRKAFLVTLKDIGDLEIIRTAGFEIGALSANTAEVFVAGNYDHFIATLSACQVLGLDVAVQTLEQVFMKYYGGEQDDKPAFAKNRP